MSWLSTVAEAAGLGLDSAKRGDPEVALGIMPCPGVVTGKILAEAEARVSVELICTVRVTGTLGTGAPNNALAVTPDSALAGAVTPACRDAPETTFILCAPAVDAESGTGPETEAAACVCNIPGCSESPGSGFALLLAGNADAAALLCAALMSALSSCSSSVSREVLLAS